MVDDYFGYTSGSNRRSGDGRGMAADHDGDDAYYSASPSGEYVQATINWDDPVLPSSQHGNATAMRSSNDNIEKIYRRVMAQDGEKLHQLGTQWFRVRQVLKDVAERVRKSAVALKEGGSNGQGWTGAGADAFLRWGPGATLKSLDSWMDAALANSNGAHKLSDIVFRRQTEMRQLYDRYEREMIAFEKDYETQQISHLPTLSEQLDLMGTMRYKEQLVTELRQFQNRFSVEAQRLEFAMAQEYWQVFNGELSGGRFTRFEGPTDAVQHSPEFLQRQMMKNLFGGMPDIGIPPSIGAPNIGAPNIDAPKVDSSQLQQLRFDAADQLHELESLDQQAKSISNVESQVASTQPGLVMRPPSLSGQGGGTTNAQHVAQRIKVPAKPAVPTGLTGLANASGAAGGLGSTPAVFKAPSAASPELSQGLPPAMPQPPKAGANQATAGKVLRAGTAAGQTGAKELPPGLPQQQRGGPGSPGAPGTTGASGLGNQFGGASSSTSSPVLRSPGAMPPPPGSTIRPQRNASGKGVSPVLGRPRPSTTDSGALPPMPSSMQTRPGADNFAVNTPPTTKPVVGRVVRPAPDAAQPPGASDGVLRASRNVSSHGGDESLGSRHKGDDEQARIHTEFERIRRLLDGEEAWTMQTPGGGVLDSAPTRQVLPSAEPKPTLGR